GPFTSDSRKVKGVIHWLSAPHAGAVEARLFDRLFSDANPDRGGADYKQFLNPESLSILPQCRVEPSLLQAAPGQSFQFERLGYFCADEKDSQPGQPIFNRIVTLRDTWGAKN
ncbi:MAG: glutamine--tRNA ligase, partial [Geobacter sp.]